MGGALRPTPDAESGKRSDPESLDLSEGKPPGLDVYFDTNRDCTREKFARQEGAAYLGTARAGDGAALAMCDRKPTSGYCGAGPVSRGEFWWFRYWSKKART